MDMDRQRRYIDDTLLYDNTISNYFDRACDLLNTCSNNGVVLDPKKFELAEDRVDSSGSH